MIALRKIAGYILGAEDKQNLVELPQGQLYIVRPLSPKGYSELIFRDAAAYIRKTSHDFQYQLVIQRAYEEGEADLEEEEGEGIIDHSDDKDEKTFLLDEELYFRVQRKPTGETVLAWRDFSGDPGDLFEFVSDHTTESEAASFKLSAERCLYERKYRRRYNQATQAELREFEFEDEPAIPEASPISSPIASSPNTSPFTGVTRSFSDILDGPDMARNSAKQAAGPPKAIQQTPTRAPAARESPQSLEVLAEEHAELHLFDFESGTFVLQDPDVEATVSDTGKWRYWLQISGTKQQWLGQQVVPDINPVFNFEYLSFIFNHYTEDGSAYSWLLKFKDRDAEERFQEGLMQALWEHLHELKYKKHVKEQDNDYVLQAFNDLTMHDIDEENEEDEQHSAGSEDESEEEDDEDEDEEEEEDEEDEGLDKDGNVNSQLAVGTKEDRSFVVRGDKIGVFKHTPGNQLEFSTSINKIATPKGKLFAPKNVMLHAQDRDMVLQNEQNPNSLYRMDLEVGKIVDEWKVHDDIPINIYAPSSKFAQTTGEQTFLGLSGSALYRVDPRLSGNKMVDSQLKQYTSKNDFSAVATTDKGYIAVASNKGDIRMFDRLGINAKTALPALGDPIIGIDTSADGRWILATTRTYLLLIDNLQKDGKNQGKLGFEKAFAKDSKPQPRRLALTPSHVAQFQHETGASLSFTTARFNMGEGKEETTIITATGPFVITWSMKKVLQGVKDPYSIKRYTEDIKADNFRFGSDKNIVVALPNEVDMVARKALQRPTRESIMATPRRSKGRGSYLSRNDIVNSPY